MSPELLSAFAALAAALTGWGMWWNARRVREDVKEGRRADDRSVLFDDALELAKAQKEISEQHKQAAEDATLALESVTVKAKQLENTIDRLMMDVDMWRGWLSLVHRRRRPGREQPLFGGRRTSRSQRLGLSS